MFIEDISNTTKSFFGLIMNLSKKEQLDILLEQIQISDDLKNEFNNTVLDKVQVLSKSKVWNFYLKSETNLSIEAYRELLTKTSLAFANIATSKFVMNVLNESRDLQVIEGYVAFALQIATNNNPNIASTISNLSYKINANELVIGVNELVFKDYKNLEQPLQKLFVDFGFPKLQIVISQDKEAGDKFNNVINNHLKNTTEQVHKAILQQKEVEKQNDTSNGPLKIGKNIADNIPVQQIVDITSEERSVVVEGYIFDAEVRELRSGRKLLILKVTDYTSSIILKKFSRDKEDDQLFEQFSKGKWVRARGSVQEDTYMRELTINLYDLQEVTHESRKDTAQTKRAELHVHSTMSMADAVGTISATVKEAENFEFPALAITDTGNVQGFPEAAKASAKANLKMIYGLEANFVEDGEPIAFNDRDVTLLDNDTEYVVFDIETTSLSATTGKVIELSAVKMLGGTVVDKFSEFINPGVPLSNTTIQLTSITNEMVQAGKDEKTVFEMFRDWYGSAVLVGHNVTFDVGFLNVGYKRYGLEEITNPIIDTLTFARFLYPSFKSYRLNTLARKFGIELEHHHRAIYDSETTAYLNWKFVKEAKEKHGITKHNELNKYMYKENAWRHTRPMHTSLLVQNELGLKNLFKLVSISNVQYFERVPRITRSLLLKYRDGLLIGSGDIAGDVFVTLMQKGYDDAKAKAKFYDYLEVQPLEQYCQLIEDEQIDDLDQLKNLIKQMVQLGKELEKPVLVTGDVKYTHPEDYIYRKILLAAQGGANHLNKYELPKAHLRTTAELLEQFSFLGEELAQEIVVDNTLKIADLIEEVNPMKDGSFPPKIPNADTELREMAYTTAKKWYGDPLPQDIIDRLEQELKAIIGNGFAAHYMIAQKLVAKSNKDGYLVGSRGSVGSSFVATMSGITEVNPLPAHYRSKHGDYLEWADPKEYESGFDLPDKEDPNHPGELLIGDGQNIPFETFMGFYGNKVPDIDLNFSGDYQPIAHDYMKVLFGKDNVFRAGTIATVAEKTAFGYVKAYERENNLSYRGTEVDRLAQGITGSKRTTGQHPGGILIVPDDHEIYDFTPVQYPADDQNALWKTTHLDYHSIHDNLLKMDILGHDDPTMLRTMQDMSGIDPKSIPVNDPGVMSLFTSPEAMNVTAEQIYSKTGTLGLPEFGTNFVRGMLEETKPNSYSELLQISGLSHGTDVWLGNANELIEKGLANISSVIGTRDKIMTDLIGYGLEKGDAFNIMEKVRKGKGITDEYQAEMRKHGVPEWYIDSALKIKYMFPRAHAAAYVLMALRIAYFKLYFPQIYYATYFSVRADNVDILAMSRGKESTKAKIAEIKAKGNEASATDKDLLTILEMANEALERGIVFKMVDIEKSDSENWIINGNELLAPFVAIPSLGATVGKQIVAARADKAFISKEDLKTRGKVSQTVIDYLSNNGALNNLPDENQLSLF